MTSGICSFNETFIRPVRSVWRLNFSAVTFSSVNTINVNLLFKQLKYTKRVSYNITVFLKLLCLLHKF